MSDFPPLLSSPASPGGPLLSSSTTPAFQPWKNLLAKQADPSSYSRSYTAPVDGKISFSDDEVLKGAQPWEMCLLGYAIGKRPPYLTLQAAIKRLWKPKGSIDLISMNEGFYLFKFSCMEDLKFAWLNGLWFVSGKPFLLKKWKPGFSPTKDPVSSILIWVKIPNLPLECWSEKGISKITSGIGKPLLVDKLTAARSRLTFARICVEVEASDPLPDSLEIFIQNKPVNLEIQYDWKPVACDSCVSFDHEPSKCPKNSDKPSSVEPNPRDRSCFRTIPTEEGTPFSQSHSHP